VLNFTAKVTPASGDTGGVIGGDIGEDKQQSFHCRDFTAEFPLQIHVYISPALSE